MKKMPIIWFPVACENKSDIHKEGHFPANTREDSFIYLYTKKRLHYKQRDKLPNVRSP